MTEKSHVGLLHQLCPICCDDVNTDVLLHKQLKPELEKDNYCFSDEFCKTCKGHLDDNRTALIEITGAPAGGEPITCASAPRTGRLFFLNNYVIKQMFPPSAQDKPFVFIDIELGDRLTAAQENAE